MSDVLEIRPADPEATRVWETVVTLAEHFGKSRNWCLVGGLMVQLHAFEREASPRPTRDIDILADARKPRGTRRAGEILRGLGAVLVDPPSTSPELGYRFEVGGQVVDLLAPDGLREPAIVLGNHQTIGIPGGTQALKRCERVTIAVAGGHPAAVWRPSLLGAILLKARSLLAHARPDAQREDLMLLLNFVADPRAMREELKGGERGWLRRAQARLDFSAAQLARRFSEPELRQAQAALDLLTGG